MSFVNSADYLRLILLDTRSCSFGSALSPFYILLEILLGKLQSGWNAVKDHTDESAVGLSENRHSESSA